MSGQSPAAHTPKGFPIPLVEWKLTGHRGHGQRGWDSRLPVPGGREPGPSGSATDSRLFLRWLHVCFQIPEAFVTPTPVPTGPLACLGFLPPLA